MAKDTKDRILATALDMFSGNTAQSAFGAAWKIRALILSLFLAIHKVFLQKTAFIRTQIFSGFALAELCGVALTSQLKVIEGAPYVARIENHTAGIFRNG